MDPNNKLSKKEGTMKHQHLMRYRCALSLIVLSIGLFSNAVAAQVVILRVDGEDGVANPVGLGNDWGANAYRYLPNGIARAQFLLDQALASEVHVWVRGSIDGPGLVYRPDQSALNPSGTNLETATFAMKPNIRLIGGFEGDESPTQIGDRRPAVFRTVLTGEISNASLRTDNCFHVVTAQTTVNPFVIVDDSARLDGFYVTAGYADGSDQNGLGGGIYVGLGASPLIQNCVITDNDATAGGGGHSEGNCNAFGEPQLPDTHPEFRSCQFIGNRATNHGAWCNNEDFVTFVNCVFRGNSATGDNGAVLNAAAGQLCDKTINIVNCTFSVNSAGVAGGAIGNGGTANLQLDHLEQLRPNQSQPVGHRHLQHHALGRAGSSAAAGH
jgi:hypothetical protein